jgi:hypothetical protein
MTTTQPTLALGTRVRTLIALTSADWHPEQPDISAGSLGTIDAHFYDQVAGGQLTSYGVMLDASVDSLSASMGPDEIEPA